MLSYDSLLFSNSLLPGTTNSLPSPTQPTPRTPVGHEGSRFYLCLFPYPLACTSVLCCWPRPTRSNFCRFVLGPSATAQHGCFVRECSRYLTLPVYLYLRSRPPVVTGTDANSHSLSPANVPAEEAVDTDVAATGTEVEAPAALENGDDEQQGEGTAILAGELGILLS